MMRYDLVLRWKKSRNILTHADTIINTGMWKGLGSEMLICLIAPYPFFEHITVYEHYEDFKLTIKFNMNDYPLCLMFARIYLLVRFTISITSFMNPRS